MAHRRGGKSRGGSLWFRKKVIDYYNQKEIVKLRGDVDSSYPHLVYFAPTKIQAREIIWNYFLDDLFPLFNCKVNNQLGQMTFERPHLGDQIKVSIMASKNHDRARGLKLTDVFFDEFQDAPPNALDSSVRPALEDSSGSLALSGTAKGKDHFYERVAACVKNDIPRYIFPVNTTDVFSPEEIINIRATMDDGEFEREYMCNFTAPLEGAFYHNELAKLETSNTLVGAIFEPQYSNILHVDLGIGKGFVAWLSQAKGSQIHLLEYYENFTDLESLQKEIEADGYDPDVIVLPHDGNRRTLTTNAREVKIKDLFAQVWKKCKIIVVSKLGNNMKMVSIANVKKNLHMLRIPSRDEVTDVYIGYKKLKEYSRKKDDNTGMFLDQIDKSRGADHAADALETLFLALGVKEGRITKPIMYKKEQMDWPRKATESIFSPKGSIFNTGIASYNVHVDREDPLFKQIEQRKGRV